MLSFNMIGLFVYKQNVEQFFDKVSERTLRKQNETILEAQRSMVFAFEKKDQTDETITGHGPPQIIFMNAEARRVTNLLPTNELTSFEARKN